MDAQEVQEYFMTFANAVSSQFEKIPGSAILARYIKSSYQNDPIRSAVELFLVLFAVRYLLAPKYSTKPNYVKLSEEVMSAMRLGRFCALTMGIQEIDDLVEDWTPEPLVAKSTAFEDADIEKRPVIVGSECSHHCSKAAPDILTALLGHDRSSQMAEPSPTSRPTITTI
jgi:serine palmitoyltransferase